MEHCAVHTISSREEIDYFYQHGIDCYALATELWEATGDLQQMTDIVRKHYEHKSELAQRKETED
jgi:hypothetical protein